MSDLWVGALATLVGTVLGGAISLLVSRQQILEARAQRADEAARDAARRSLDRRFDAYALFVTSCRAYRNATRHAPLAEGSAEHIDHLAASADSAASLIQLVTESVETARACRAVALAIGLCQELIRDHQANPRNERWQTANHDIAELLRSFQATARVELGVGNADLSAASDEPLRSPKPASSIANDHSPMTAR